MKKQIELCYPCYKNLDTAYVLTEVRTGVNKKINCEGCGKRRFGAVYAVGKKRKGEVDKG